MILCKQSVIVIFPLFSFFFSDPENLQAKNLAHMSNSSILTCNNCLSRKLRQARHPFETHRQAPPIDMGDDLAAKREEERLMRAFTGAKSPRSFAPKPAAATSPAPAAVTQPAAAAPKSWAKPAPAVAKPAADVSVAVSSPASGSSAGIVVAARSPPGAAAAAPAPAAAAAAPAPVVVAAPAPAAAPSPAVAAPPGSGGGAAVTSTIPARPGPSFPKGKPAAVAVAATAPPTLKQGALETAQVAPTNLGGGSSNVYTSARIPTLRGRKDVQRGVQIWQGKMLEDESKLRLAQVREAFLNFSDLARSRMVAILVLSSCFNTMH